MKSCILCKSKLEKIFSIKNMPASAQDIPCKEELKKDKGIDVSLCCCNFCGLVQLSTEAVSYYKDVIRASAVSSTMDGLRRKQYAEFIEICKLEGEKIVEVGCGAGEFINILKDYPVKVYGLENKPELVKKAREAGLCVEEGFAISPEYKMKEAPFKAFVSFNFLEHQPEPLNYLKCIYNNLDKEAYGLITVPSFEYIMEKKSFYEFIPDHLAYYTKETLSLCLNNAGFELIKEERINRDTLAAIVRKKMGPDMSALIRQKDLIQKELSELIEDKKSRGQRIAVWGASHQGFTLLSTLDLGKNIEYIIDSAKFKQGRFSPASHIPIISPEDAVKNQVDCIIITAPGYVSEISKILKEKMSAKIEIYALRSEKLERIN